MRVHLVRSRSILAVFALVCALLAAFFVGEHIRRGTFRHFFSLPQLQVKSSNFMFSNLKESDIGRLVSQLDSISNRYFSVRGFQDYRPFFFSIDGRAYLPPSVIRTIVALPPSLNWIGDDTMQIIISSPQYAAVMTSDGILYGGFSKNCILLNRLLKTQKNCVYDMLFGGLFGFPFLLDTLGEIGFIDFISQEKIDAIIAGPRTYQKSKEILQQYPKLDACFKRQMDRDNVLILLKRPCTL